MIICSAYIFICQYQISVELHGVISMRMTHRPRFHHLRHHHRPLDAPLLCLFFLLFNRPALFSFKRDDCVMIMTVFSCCIQSCFPRTADPYGSSRYQCAPRWRRPGWPNFGAVCLLLGRGQVAESRPARQDLVEVLVQRQSTPLACQRVCFDASTSSFASAFPLPSAFASISSVACVSLVLQIHRRIMTHDRPRWRTMSRASLREPLRRR